VLYRSHDDQGDLYPVVCELGLWEVAKVMVCCWWSVPNCMFGGVVERLVTGW
jgi:hypothetical protein